MSFIDASYFVGELDIPNPGQTAIAERISYFITKYEPIFLQKLMGYPLYKAFVAGMTVIPPATPPIRLLNILYGVEYTDFQGRLQKWKGLIVTDTPVFTMAGGLAYKIPAYLKVGVTTGLVANTTSATFDGTNGTDDWRGWTPIFTRTTIMRPGVDYSWDIVNGIWTLLVAGDKFGPAENFFAQFQPRTDGAQPVLDLSNNESCIANYVYFQYRKAGATQYTGIGEVVTSAENANNASPRKRMAACWNALHGWVKEFCAFMEATNNADPTIYPEWQLSDEHHALRTFGFMNPIF